MSPEPTTLLIEKLKAGDHEAARDLWRDYFPRLVALARQRLQAAPRRVADEEDVALSAFNSFCKGAEQGRFPDLGDRGDLWGLLVTITARKAADLANRNNALKRGGGRARGDSAVTPADGEGGFDELPGKGPTPDMAALLAEELQRLLDRLDDAEDNRLREIAVWKMEGYRIDEIAQRLGCSPPTVERRLRLIRTVLTGA